MSVQIFLQGKLLGVEGFLPASADDFGPCSQRLLVGRSRWVTLLTEVLPRALLNELGLSKVLLGSSGGGQLLVVLPLEAKPQAESFLEAAAAQILELSGGRLQLASAITENLGDWSVVRKRLNDVIGRQRSAPAATAGSSAFDPVPLAPGSDPGEYFSEELAIGLQTAESAGWSPEAPGKVQVGSGKYTWPLASTAGGDSIAMARHAATTDDGRAPAYLATLASRAKGRSAWGILRGDVDALGIRFRRAQSVEEHIQLSFMYKQFFAAELELVCSMPEYWRKVSILYSGGDDFAVFGAWDALIPLAREIQRLFHGFSEGNLKDFPGPEGKSITMAIAIARDIDADIGSIFEEAARLLDVAKSADKDCIHVLGQTLEWRQLAAASDLRETMLRMAAQVDSPRRFLTDLDAFYRKASAAGRREDVPGRSFEKPWRVQRYLSRALGDTRDQDLQKLRSHLTNEILAKGSHQLRLRPGGKAALEWARLLSEV